MINFIVADRDQPYLLPPSLHEWLPENHLAWFALDAVDQMDIRAFYEGFREDGRGGAAFEPSLMVSLLLYSYCVGERSSRQIERLCETDVAFRIIAANLKPDHATIARFRRNHKKEVNDLFVRILRLCREAGLVKMGTVALDGTKMKADAALDANRTHDGLEAEVTKMLAEAETKDQEEDAEQERKIRERAAEEAATGEKIRGRKPTPPDPTPAPEAKANVTDPESRIMKTRSGYVQGYNAQAAVMEEQIIVAAEVTQEANDVRQFHPMMSSIRETASAAGIRERAGVCAADAGYWSEENARGDGRVKTEFLIATMKDWKQRKALRDLPSPRGRIPKAAASQDRMERKLRTKRGRHLYRKRSQTVEPVFGQIKDARGIDRFLLRGLGGAELEWKLICGTHNLLKLWRSGAGKTIH